MKDAGGLGVELSFKGSVSFLARAGLVFSACCRFSQNLSIYPVFSSVIITVAVLGTNQGHMHARQALPPSEPTCPA